MTDPHRPPRGGQWSVLLALGCWLPACRDGEDLQGTAPPAVARVVVEAPTTTIPAGDSLQLAATAYDAEGTLLADRRVEWASRSPEVAAVSESGRVAALTAGQAEIAATIEEVTGTIVITVTGPPPPLPPPPPPPPPPPGPTAPGLEEIASGLDFPLGLAVPPGDARLFVAQKGGRIVILRGGSVLPEAFLDLSGRVADGAEQGLLGFAFFPDYAASGRFVVHYTDLENDIRISEFRVSADPDRADLASETPILTVPQSGPDHNGGQVAFGPDGMLYVALGDGGLRGGEGGGSAQDLSELQGSVLRIDVTAGADYRVPADNPFVGSPEARPEIWSYGLRNPWRFSFDRETGDLYIADVGQSTWEEVNRARAADGGGRGVNYGWSIMEGPACSRSDCDPSGLTPPTVAYHHDEGCSVTGGYVYRGEALPALQGRYLFGDFCRGWVRSFAASDESPALLDHPSLSVDDNITSLGEDAAGELYILTAGGSVFRIVPR